MTTDQTEAVRKPAVISFEESCRILLRSVKITVLLCSAPVVWGAWWYLAKPANPPVLHWLVPIVSEGCTAYIVLLWFALDRAPRRLQQCGWALLALNAAALAVGQILVWKPRLHVPVSVLSLACLSPVAVLIVTVVAFGVAHAEFEIEDAEFRGRLLGARVGFPVGRSVPGDISPDAGNALTGTAVYRFFTVTRDLIYTGKSRNFPTRFNDHRAKKSWFGDVHHMTVVWYEDEASALAAEERAIKTEGPRENVTHNPARKPQETR